MKKLKIGSRIALSLLLPIIGLILFSGSFVLEKQQTASEMDNLQEMARLAPVISDLVHELQKERGVAAVYIGSKGKKFTKELPQQIAATDQKLVSLTDALQNFDASAFDTVPAEKTEDGPDTFNPILEKISAATEALLQIDKTRKSTQKRRTTGLRMATYYTKTIAKLLSVIEQMSALSTDAKVTSAISAYTNFLQSKERAGIERDMGGTGFSTGVFRFFVHKKFVELIAQQEAFHDAFIVNATPEQVAFYNNTITGSHVEEVKRMRVIAIASIQDEFDLQGVTADQWSNSITIKIELLKLVEDRLASDLLALVSDIYSSAQTAFISLLILTLVLLAVTMVFVVFVVRGITGPVSLMTSAMERLAGNDLTVDIPAQDHEDEIGEMATAVQVFKDNAIEKANLEVVQEAAHKEEERKTQEILQFVQDVSNFADGAKLGDLTTRLSFDGQDAALSDATTHLNDLIETVECVINDTVSVLSAMAKGDLTQTMTDHYQGSFNNLKTDSTATIERLKQVVGDISASTGVLRTSSSEIAEGSGDLASRTEQQASNLEETAAAMEELVATVRQNAENARQADQFSASARTAAEKGGEIVSEAVASVAEIAESSSKISDIVTMIDEIAFQTNLLALNAAVEAARAGEAGKGFAVVATEVRALAQRASGASKEIKSLIDNSISQINVGVEQVNSTGETLDEIVSAVKKVADIVSEITAASQEQALGLEEINVAVMNMDEMTQQNAALVEETTAAAQSQQDQAESLARLVSFFKVGS